MGAQGSSGGGRGRAVWGGSGGGRVARARDVSIGKRNGDTYDTVNAPSSPPPIFSSLSYPRRSPKPSSLCTPASSAGGGGGG